MTLSIIPYIVTLYIILVTMHLSLKTHHLTCMNCDFEFVGCVAFDDHCLQMQRLLPLISQNTGDPN